MNNLLKSNLFYVITSVLLAIFLLFYVDSIENPIDEKIYNINLATRGIPSGLLMDQTPIPLKVKVSGNKSSFYAITSKDIKAWVNLDEAQAGLNNYNIQTTLPTGISLVWLEPKTVDIYLDQIGSKTIDLKYEILNEVANGYGSFEPILTPQKIEIKGPQLILAKIDHGLVRVNLKDLRKDYEAELPIVLIGKDFNVIEDPQITMSQLKTKVLVTITENMSSKSVQVRPAITGEIKENWLVSSVAVVPTTVRITGAFDIIKNIEYLNTETIDLALLEENFSDKVNLNIPEGVGVLDGTQVDVNIILKQNLTSRTIKEIPIEIRNVPDDQKYGSLPTKVDVELLAYPWVFANHSIPEGGYKIAVKAYVDLEKLPANSKDYEVKIEIPEGFQVGDISTKVVRIHSN